MEIIGRREGREDYGVPNSVADVSAGPLRKTVPALGAKSCTTEKEKESQWRGRTATPLRSQFPVGEDGALITRPLKTTMGAADQLGGPTAAHSIIMLGHPSVRRRWRCNGKSHETGVSSPDWLIADRTSFTSNGDEGV